MPHSVTERKCAGVRTERWVEPFAGPTKVESPTTNDAVGAPAARKLLRFVDHAHAAAADLADQVEITEPATRPVRRARIVHGAVDRQKPFESLVMSGESGRPFGAFQRPAEFLADNVLGVDQ